MMQDEKRRKIAAAFITFLFLMWLCTLIAKSVYALGLPQVTVSSPEKRSIEHQVETEGIIKQGGDTAIYTLPDLRVERIFVRVGDTVEEGSLLFSLATEDLAEAIGNKELEAAKLRYQISDLENNRKQQAKKEQIERERAAEDYQAARIQGDTAVKRAEDGLNKAKKRLEALKNQPVELTSKEEREEAYEEYNRWLEELEKAEGTVSGNTVAKPDFSGEDSEKKAWEAEREALEDNVEDADNGKEDALAGRNELLTKAQRELEDAQMPSLADSTLEIYRLQLNKLEKEIQKYREINRDEGEVKSDRKGTVTRINLSAGERTPDGAAIVCADAAMGFQCEVIFTKEQKKYINQGDKVSLQTAGWKKELRMDYLAEEETNPGSYRGIIRLPENEGTIGMSALMSKKETSESYECCIPAEALYSGNNNRYFVYILTEKEGILGKELCVESRYVRVLDQNERYAALEDGAIGKEEQVVTGTDKALLDNQVVRMRNR